MIAHVEEEGGGGGGGGMKIKQLERQYKVAVPSNCIKYTQSWALVLGFAVLRSKSKSYFQANLIIKV